MSFRLEIQATDGAGRSGVLYTNRGEVRTPLFMPVGTRASVRGITPRELVESGAEIVLANTYHLYLRPGHETIRALGGLHRFMAWERPLLTDSGGYQVMSLASHRKIVDGGVRFRSHLDGSAHFLTPELAIEVQNALGVDIIMPLDVCPPAAASTAEVERAVQLSADWLGRCIEAHERPFDQALFGIVQGGVDPAMRMRSLELTLEHDLPGYSIGGLAVGEEKAVTMAMVELVASQLPADRPRYLMGVGTPSDLVEAVARGVDMFDSVIPTRNARNAGLFSRSGRLNLRNAMYKRDDAPIDSTCRCYTCRTFSRAYLRHLVLAGEILAPVLLTIHNLRHFLDTMERIRQAIASQQLGELRRELARAGAARAPAGAATAT